MSGSETDREKSTVSSTRGNVALTGLTADKNRSRPSCGKSKRYSMWCRKGAGSEAPAPSAFGVVTELRFPSAAHRLRRHDDALSRLRELAPNGLALHRPALGGHGV